MNDERIDSQDRRASGAVWLTLRQAAARAAVSEGTLKREIQRGRIRCARVGGRRHLRFRAAWIDAWLDASTTPSEGPSRLV